MARVSVISGYLVAPLMTAAIATAQTPRRTELPSVPICAQCTIELTTVGVLGRKSDSVLLGAVSGAVALNSRGHFIVPAGSGFQIGVYDTIGRAIRWFGKRGRGPGEFQSIGTVRIGRADTLIVADARNGLLFFSPDFEYVRSVRIPAPGSFARAVVLRTGEIVKQTGPDMLAVIGPAGTVRESIPVTPVPALPTCASCNLRWLAAASAAGRIWSSVSNRYEITQFDRNGPIRVFTRRPDWYSAWDSTPAFTMGSQQSVQPPALTSLREDADGILWSLASVPDPKWRDVDTRGPASVAMFNGLRDGVITAIDPRAGAVLAERRLAEPVGFIDQSDLIFSQEEDADGYVRLRISRVYLKRP